MKLLFIGDIVGKSGRKAVKDFLPLLMSEYSPDIVIANGPIDLVCVLSKVALSPTQPRISLPDFGS